MPDLSLDPISPLTPRNAIQESSPGFLREPKSAEVALQGIVIQRHFKALFVNQAYADIFGYIPKEILAVDSTLPLFALGEHTRLQAYYEACLQGESIPCQYACQGVRKDGALIWVWVEHLFRLGEWEAQLAGQGTCLDITVRQQTEVVQKQLSE